MQTGSAGKLGSSLLATPFETGFFLIEPHWLMGAVQGEGGDLEAFAVPIFHLIVARHDA
jgi:hypothetical protein